MRCTVHVIRTGIHQARRATQYGCHEFAQRQYRIDTGRSLLQLGDLTPNVSTHGKPKPGSDSSFQDMGKVGRSQLFPWPHLQLPCSEPAGFGESPAASAGARCTGVIDRHLSCSLSRSSRSVSRVVSTHCKRRATSHPCACTISRHSAYSTYQFSTSYCFVFPTL
jgi:hypothetical protein